MELARGFSTFALLVAGVLCQVFIGEHRTFADDAVRQSALTAMLRDHHVPGVEVKYSLLMPLASAPFWYLDRAFHLTFFVDRFNTAVVAMGLLGFYFILRKHLDRRLLGTFLLLFFYASMYPHHLVYYFGEVFSSVMVGVGIAAICTQRPRLGWPLVIAGVVNTPALIVPLALVCAVRVWETKKLRLLLPILFAVLLICGENAWRKGGPFVTGYINDGYNAHHEMPYTGLPGFSYPFAFGVASILFSFGRGIMFFAPGLWGVRSSRDLKDPIVRDMLLLMFLFLGGMVVVYARWWAWHGALFWGPRLFLFASLPATLLVAARMTKTDATLGYNTFTLLLLLASFWVGISGIWFRWGDLPLSICDRADGAACLYAPELSPLVNRFVYPKSLDARQLKMTYPAVAAFAFVTIPFVITVALQAWRTFRTLARTTFRRSIWNF